MPLPQRTLGALKTEGVDSMKKAVLIAALICGACFASADSVIAFLKAQTHPDPTQRGVIVIRSMDPTNFYNDTNTALADKLGASDFIRAVGDFNGDGHLDLLIENGNHRLSVWFYDGSWNRTGTQQIANAPASTMSVIGAADLDGDGMADIVFQDSLASSHVVRYWTMNGAARLTAGNLFSMETTLRLIGVGDFTGSTKPDFMIQRAGTRSLYVRPGNGTAKPDAAITWDNAYTSGGSTWVHGPVADFNNDGLADVMFIQPTNLNTRRLSELGISSSSGGFSAFSPAPASPPYWIPMAAGSIQITDVTMQDTLSFSPKTITVPAGSVVRWTNVSGFIHSVEPDRGVPSMSSDTQYPGGMTTSSVFTWTVPAGAASGTQFFYHCGFHGTAGDGFSFGTGMVGVVVVK
jgi:plastocyanin